MSALRTDDSWQLKAACRGPQAAVFFPPSHFERKDEKLEREHRAKAICGTCPARKPCLDFAIEIREPHGIWGGLNETERKQVMVHRGL
ncbi:MAG: WhiB family transcriptional regulator [Acidimicrobiales bacterium]